MIYLESCKNIIEFIKKTIESNNISLHYLSKQMNVPRIQLKRIIYGEIKSTKINILELYSLIKKINDKSQNLENIQVNNHNKENNPDSCLKIQKIFNSKNLDSLISKRAEKVLYLLSIMNEIKNYQNFFNDCFYLINKSKTEKFNKDLLLLLEHDIISIKNNTLFPGKNFFVPDLSLRTRSLNINYALQYLEKKELWGDAYHLSLYLNNTRKREYFLIQYCFNLYRNEKYDEIINLFNNFFKQLRAEKKRKSRQLKIFYISILINIYSDQNKIINSFLYGNYLMKYIPIKKNLLLDNFNDKFDLSEIYELDRSYTPQFSILSYFVFCSLIDIIRCYLKLQLYEQANSFSDYFIEHLPVYDKYYSYFFQFKSILVSYFGSISDYYNLKIIVDRIPSQNINKNELKFKIDHMISILEVKNKSNINELEDPENSFDSLNKYFVENFPIKNIHSSYLALFCERYIWGVIFQKKYDLAISALIYFNYNRVLTEKLECKAHLVFLFLAILKNPKKRKILLTPFRKNIIDLRMSDLSKYFDFPDSEKLFNISKNFFNEKLKLNIDFFDNFSLFDFFKIVIKNIIIEREKFKANYNNLLLDIQKKKDKVFEYIKIKLKENLKNNNIKFYSSKLIKKDPIKYFIEIYPFDAQLLSVFSYKSLEKQIFSDILAVQEINFYISFLKSISLLSPKNETLKTNQQKVNIDDIDFDNIYNITINKVDISSFYKDYLSKHIKNISLNNLFRKNEENENNITYLFFNLFNIDKDKPFLTYIKSYILQNI